MSAATPWHRLLGMVLTDLFTGRPWRVDLEQELALKSQRLDVLIIERQPGMAAAPPADDLAGLPDGLEGLAAHRLEVPEMAYTVDDFMRDTYALIGRDLATLTPDQRQFIMERFFDADERPRGLDPEQRVCRGSIPTWSTIG